MPESEKDGSETLRCIRCQRTITWPLTSVYPRGCFDCGMPFAYTAERVIRPGMERPAEGGEQP